MKKLISIVIPAFNEEENIDLIYQELMHVTGGLSNYLFEFIFVDDCSDDGTLQRMVRLSQINKNVKIIKLSRNFGHQRAIFTGFNMASGDAAIQLDCDLQDPPRLIPELIRKWEMDYQVVYGIRKTRQEGKIITFVRKLFYRMLNLISSDNIPLDAGDFRLVDRKILNELKGIHDYNPYIRGTIAFLGFRQTGVPYDRQARLKGKSKFGVMKLMALATDAVLNHSIIPLRVASFTGLVLAAMSLIAMGTYILLKILFGLDWPSGFATTTILILASITLNALFLGVIGEYLGRIYQQVKKQPITVIDKLVNFDMQINETDADSEILDQGVN